MATRTRLKGKSIVFEIDGVSYVPDVTSVVLAQEEADDDVVTFEDAAAGGSYQDYLEITAIQSLDAGSFHMFLEDNQGAEVDFTFAPLGNAEPSASAPHYEGTVTIKEAPAVGGETNTTATFEVRLDLTAPRTKNVGIV